MRQVILETKRINTQAIKMGWGWGGADGQCIKLMGQSSFVTLTWSKYFVNHLWPEGWRCEQFQLPEGLPGGGREGWMFKFRLDR